MAWYLQDQGETTLNLSLNYEKKSTFWSCSWKINTIWRHFQLPWCRFAPITAHWLSINICQLLLWEIDNVVKECWFIFDQHHLVFWQFDLSLLSKRERERERKGRFLIRLLLVSVDAEMQSVRTIALSVCVIFATQQMSGGLWVQATWREVKRFTFAYAIHIVMIQRFSCNYWTVKWNPPKKTTKNSRTLKACAYLCCVGTGLWCYKIWNKFGGSGSSLSWSLVRQLNSRWTAVSCWDQFRVHLEWIWLCSEQTDVQWFPLVVHYKHTLTLCLTHSHAHLSASICLPSNGFIRSKSLTTWQQQSSSS